VQSQNTIDNYRWAIEKHLIPALGPKRLRSLAPEDVDKMLTAKAEAGMSKNSLIRLRSVLARALKDAQARRKTAWNVAALVDVPEGRTTEGRSLTVHEAKILLAAATGDRLEALVCLGLMLGLRPGELLGLTWADLDLAEARARITQALKREKAGLRLGAVKTVKSNRVVDLPPRAVKALRRHKVRQTKDRLAAGALWKDMDLVFATAVGTPIDPRNLRRMFARLTEGAGLGRWHPHELRHSNYSLLAAAGAPIEQIADLQGHRDTKMGDTVYRHRVTASIDTAVKPMEKMFGKS
jgi:integrase